jgi:hypothetical protein
VRHKIPERREIAEDPDQDVYFWDGQVCVRSSVITIGDPPTNTISVQNLQGVSLSKNKPDIASIFLFALGGCLFLGMTALGVWADWAEFKWWIFNLSLGVMALWFCIRLALELHPSPWQITMKLGGMLADEVFSSHDQQWAEKFAQAVSQAIAIEQHRRGGGGQSVPQAPIFPDPTSSRN